MRWTILTISVTLVMMAFAASVAADDLVSVSGECYNEDYNEGGKAHLAVNEDGQVNEQGVYTNENGDLDPLQSGGAVDALSHFALQSAQSSPGEACQGETTDDRKDYLAVTVLGVMVCYDGDPNVWTSPDAWDCATRPTGNPNA